MTHVHTAKPGAGAGSQGTQPTFCLRDKSRVTGIGILTSLNATSEQWQKTA